MSKYVKYEIQVGDIIEEFNYTGSSKRETLKEFVVTSVTKTIAKADTRRFKREAEYYINDEGVKGEILTHDLDKSKRFMSVLAHRVKSKENI